MICVFFKSTGLVHIHFIENGETINADNLERFNFSINDQKPISGTKNKKFHHDNAKPHVAECVRSYLKCTGFTIIRFFRFLPF
jgi:hypothetical protein